MRFRREELKHQMQGVRPAAVAGLFYPDSRVELRRMIDRLLRSTFSDDAAPLPKAILTPHAGYVYSGPVAASAMEAMRCGNGRVERVVLIGPSHRVRVRGLALPAADCFETPLGKVEIDIEASRSLLDLPQVRIDAAPHAREHGLEVEIPFLQQVFGHFRIVPLVAGDATVEEVSEVLERLWGGDETVFVISSDLSHFLDYDAAREMDQDTVERILRFEESIDVHHACGAAVINGFLPVAKKHHLEPKILDLRNSGDTAGGRDRVVGYCAMAFCRTARCQAA